tara:strand:- start:6 stop:584 length:579 start_codon:yes stop_codon:yes gene_type:complete
MLIKIFIFYILLITPSKIYAEFGSDTGFKLPRYVSIKSNDANLRVGPSINYPIIIKYIKKNYPIKIIEEYQDWRKIIDINNNNGWIHKSLINGDRNGIIISTKKNNLKIYNTKHGKIIGEITPGSLISLNKCKIDWCLISDYNNHRGWIKKENIWGVDKNETFNLSFFQTFYDYFFQSINLIDAKTSNNNKG